MTANNIEQIASNAIMIVCGYAFMKMDNSNIRIVSLQAPHHALVISAEGEVLETSMDDVELEIVLGYWERNKKHMEDAYAEVL